MRIFIMELKKLLNWRILLVLVLFSGLFYRMFLYNDMFFLYTNSRPHFEFIEVGKYMLQKYGTEIDEADRKDFEQNYFQETKKPLNAQIAKMEVFRDAKVTNVDQMEALGRNGKTKKLYENLFDKLNDYYNARIVPGQPSEFYLYQVARDAVDTFHYYPEWAAETKAEDHPGEVINTKSASVFPTTPMFQSWLSVADLFNVLLLVTVAVLLSPYLVRDSRSGVRSLAYTCKKGRSLFGTQFAASCAAALLAVLAQTGVLAACCLAGPRKADLLFFRCDVYNWMSYPEQSGVMFGKLVAMCLLTAFFQAAAFAFLSFAVSVRCRNYVTVIAIQVPLLFLGSEGSRRVFQRFLSLGTVKFGKTALCAALAVLTLGVCLWLVRREKKRNVYA